MKNTLKATSMIAVIYLFTGYQELSAQAKKDSIKERQIDEVVMIGTRFYVKATVILIDTESKDKELSNLTCTAYAREDEIKKGMDGSQITGASSSYARKYALNGLLAIDDTKDADTDEYTEKTKDAYDRNSYLQIIKEMIK